MILLLDDVLVASALNLPPPQNPHVQFWIRGVVSAGARVIGYDTDASLCYHVRRSSQIGSNMFE